MSPKVTTNGKSFQLTAEQIALSAERKAKKQKIQSTENNPAAVIVNRAWIQLENTYDERQQEQQIKVLTWNVRLSFYQQL